MAAYRDVHRDVLGAPHPPDRPHPMLKSIRERIGIVRLQKFFDTLRHSLSFIPGLYVVGAVIFAQLVLWIDRSVDDAWLPEYLTTSVGGARAMFGAIAGGLITSITLLLSMMLITIQLASVQFSPRSLRDWLGDRLLQHTVGLALGTTVFSLSAMRVARSIGEGDTATDVTPHLSVIVALLLAIIALFGVVRSVDHVTHSVRIGSVSRRIANETISIVVAEDELRAGQYQSALPATATPSAGNSDPGVPEHAEPVVTDAAGWVQQIDDNSILQALPDGATGYVTAPLGGFLAAGSPLLWVDPPTDLDDEVRRQLKNAFATGDSRTLQQDVSFGLMQLTDIAVRALSPGVNDPGTAVDIIVQLGNVLLAIWARPPSPSERSDDGRTLMRRQTTHDEHLRRSFEPIRRYGIADPQVLLGLVQQLRTMRAEIERRGLPGPIEPIDALLETISRTADRTTWSDAESDEIDEALG